MRIWLAVLIAVSAAHAQADETFVVREIGSFYVGGRSVSLRAAPQRPRVRRADSPAEKVDPNGDFEFGQIYVQYVQLAQPRNSLPLLLWPGGSVTGVTYETTPDGRRGWQSLFLRHGYSVFTADTSQAGRSAWAKFPEINPDEPIFRSKQFLWEVFRLGPAGSFASAAAPKAYPDTRFPVAAFTELAKQAMPRFRMAPEQEREAYDALITRVCPCILLAHSAAGPFALDAARRHDRLIAGVVLLEPSAAIALASQEQMRSKPVPHLFVWGDHLDLSRSDGSWAQQYFAAKGYHDALRAAGASSTWIHLPERGIRGNSHMLMMDDNSADIAEMIHQWIVSNVRRRN